MFLELARLKYLFLRFAILSIGGTALAKAITRLVGNKLLLLGDPLFPFLSNWQMLVLAVGFEVSVVCVLIRPLRDTDKLRSILWLCSVFFAYRLGLVWIGFHGYCRCLGSMSDWLHISPAVTDGISKGILFVLMVGAALLLVAEVRRPTREKVRLP